MMKIVRLCVLLLACLMWLGCGDDGTQDPPVDAPMGELLELYESCEANEQCESGICHPFGQGGPLCTKTCEMDEECPEPSPGCSPMQMVCKRPGAN